MTTITKAGIEQAGLAWLPGAGWRIAHGPDIAPGTSGWVATGPAGISRRPSHTGTGKSSCLRKEGVQERLNLQRDGSHAKPYQVRQVRRVILRYRLEGED